MSDLALSVLCACEYVCKDLVQFSFLVDLTVIQLQKYTLELCSVACLVSCRNVKFNLDT